MAVAKSNGLLKILVPTVIFVVITVAVMAMKGRQNDSVSSAIPEDVIKDMSKEELESLGMTAGDTPHDTLRTLLSTVQKTKREVEQVREENKRLNQEKQHLQANSGSINRQIADAVAAKEQQLKESFDEKLRMLEQRLGMQNGELNPQEIPPQPQQNANDIPIGFGHAGSESNSQGYGQPGQGESEQVVWFDPLDQTENQVGTSGKKTISFPNLFNTLDKSQVGQAHQQLTGQQSDNQSGAPTNVPVYTLPRNSTLMGSVSMTALIGRVPIDGTVTDSYPFKVMIGRDNLIANGIELPNVEGAIVSGTASGDWVLSCVRGTVQSITFVFSDGRVSSSPKDERSSGSSNSSGGLGWISNPEGVPCVPGERKTNAREYLASQFLLSGATAAADNFANGETTTVVEDGAVMNAVTGQRGRYVIGQAIGGGLKETSDWFKQRYGQMFDAIYVPPGQAVAIHLDKTVEIDYDFNARKVNYSYATQRKALD